LAATAITAAHAEQIASQARMGVAAEYARRRIEGDPHDGAQQRLVPLVLKVRSAVHQLAAELDGQSYRLTNDKEGKT
jgi:hypothetical protein